MIHVFVRGTRVYGKADTPVTSGTIGRKVRFEFDSNWDGLVKTAVFECGSISICTYLGDATECDLPWEILVEENVDKTIVIGVRGYKDDVVVYPTIYTNIDKLYKGTKIEGEQAAEPTPDLIDQLILTASRAEQAVVHPPIIGDNGNWLCWNFDTASYYDTGIWARGDIPDNMESTDNRVKSIDENSDDDHYPTAGAVRRLVGDIETALDNIIAIQESYISEVGEE